MRSRRLVELHHAGGREDDGAQVVSRVQAGAGDEEVARLPGQRRPPGRPVDDPPVEAEANDEAGERVHRHRHREAVKDEARARVREVELDVGQALDETEDDAGERGQEGRVQLAAQRPRPANQEQVDAGRLQRLLDDRRPGDGEEDPEAEGLQLLDEGAGDAQGTSDQRQRHGQDVERQPILRRLLLRLRRWRGRAGSGGLRERSQGVEMALEPELTRGAEVLRLNYHPTYDPIPVPAKQRTLIQEPTDRSGVELGKLSSGFAKALKGSRKEDIARGSTSIGPHRDELRFLGNGVDLGTFGSRGQVRTTLLTLKLAELEWMQARSGFRPVLLLDEVLAELDETRRADLLGRLGEKQQVLLTTTDFNLFTPEFLSQAKRWEVEEGRLQK